MFISKIFTSVVISDVLERALLNSPKEIAFKCVTTNSASLFHLSINDVGKKMPLCVNVVYTRQVLN